MWRRALVALIAGAALLAAPAVASAATSLQRAVAYMARAQNSDGGYAFAPNAASTPEATQWAAIGLRDAGERLHRFARPGGDSLATAVARTAARAASDAPSLARAVLALDASGGVSTLPRRLAAMQGPDGSWDANVTTTAFAVFALRASGRRSTHGDVRRAARWLARAQHRDGGFGLGAGAGQSGIDVTAAALQGLWRGGYARSSAPVRRAVRYLRRQQGADGGFPLQAGSASNAQSTAWAVQAFAAAGVDPARVRRSGSRDPLAYLRSLQASDGSIRYSRTSAQTPVWVTAQALSALSRKPF